MPKDPVLQVGSPVLRAIAKPIAKKDIRSRKLQSVIKRMKGILAKEPYGVAIAAPQVGESLRLFVVAGKIFTSKAGKARGEHRTVQPTTVSEAAALPAEDRVFINPEITRASKKKKEMSEGCLSVRGKYGSVLRHEKVTLKALDERGKPITYHGAGLIGHIFQHEVDHLNGILYTDKTITLIDEEELKEVSERHLKEERE
jgi:peptide deformylase